MRDLLSDYDRLAAEGRPVGRAVVTSVWGSAPRPEGSSMLATADGTMAGSVSGGCVEGATAIEIGEAIGRGTPTLVTFGVTHERASAVADTQEWLDPEPAGARPPTPLLLDVGGGVHQDAIQIKEHRGALEAFHVSL